MGLFDSDDSLFDLDEVVGKVSQTSSDTFMPWHKPRKQYIRDKQWVQHLVRLVRATKYRDVETINYFGLPGGDLLDINYIHSSLQGVSKYNGKKLSFHGLINSDRDYQKAQGEFTKLIDMDDISDKSRLDHLDFEDLNKENSEAWVRIRNFGLYHFINLDFCKNVLTEKTLPSLHYILEYQMSRVKGLPWLLCITTRLNKDSTNKDIIDKFHVVIKDAIAGDALGNKIKECFSEAYECMKNIDDINNVDNKKLINEILQICLVLWVLRAAIARSAKIELKSSFKYSVDLFNRELDMHSFVFSFECEDVVLSDCLGIVSGRESAAEDLTLESVAPSVINKLSTTLDVDDYLERTPDELEKYANEMMELLKKCGYDVSGYKKYMNETFGYNCII